MKISEGIKLKGRPFEIPDCSRDDLPEFFKEQGFKVGVEIGVFKGEYTEVLAKSGLQIYGIDPWEIYEDYGTPGNDRQVNRRYKSAVNRLSPYPNVTLIKKKSMDALADFENESLDFVYIDGNHKFRFIADDIFEWDKKVKTGGVICGHDYAYFKSQSPCGGCQAREIVDAWVQSFQKDFWVLGTRIRKGDQIRDDYRSWLFIKS